MTFRTTPSWASRTTRWYDDNLLTAMTKSIIKFTTETMLTRMMVNVIVNQVGINTSFLDLGFNNLRKVPNLALRKLVKAMVIKIMMMMMIMFEVAVMMMGIRKLVVAVMISEADNFIVDDDGDKDGEIRARQDVINLFLFLISYGNRCLIESAQGTFAVLNEKRILQIKTNIRRLWSPLSSLMGISFAPLRLAASTISRSIFFLLTS